MNLSRRAITLHRFSPIVLASFALFLSYPLKAQIIADDSLPANTLVTINDRTFKIDGGTTKGGNLFHSFTEFSLPTLYEAFFNNAETIHNIISRVTGGNLSSIDGLIRANGSANLFILNPNGIIFGTNASLNIGGSFIASTADSLQFADGSEFSATDPQTPSILTINVPIGLQYGQHPGAIRVQGTGHSLTIGGNPFFRVLERSANPAGLQVRAGNTLALIGGDVILEGGTLTAQEGRIELSSVDSALVKLNPALQGWAFSYTGVENFGDIQLSQRALADVSGVGSGSIQIQGASVLLKEGWLGIAQSKSRLSSRGKHQR
ncbi:MAG: filamentous hemagglutinin N-terminal domain-containing protein [Microcystaceae cyanobacterium]